MLAQRIVSRAGCYGVIGRYWFVIRAGTPRQFIDFVSTQGISGGRLGLEGYLELAHGTDIRVQYVGKDGLLAAITGNPLFQP